MRLTSLIIVVTIFFIQGCETARGMKKDVTNFVHGTCAEDGWVRKMDNWMREHMW